MQIRPRSGISLRTKLRISNTPGTIDSDYRGEVVVIVDNIRSAYEDRDFIYRLECVDGSPAEYRFEYVPYGSYLVRKYDRIAQAVIVPVPDITFVEVDEELTETGRGANGFGSSGF